MKKKAEQEERAEQERAKNKSQAKDDKTDEDDDEDEKQTLPVTKDGEHPGEDGAEKVDDNNNEDKEEEARKETTDAKTPARKKAVKPPSQKCNTKTSNGSSEKVVTMKSHASKMQGVSTTIASTLVSKKSTRSVCRKQ